MPAPTKTTVAAAKPEKPKGTGRFITPNEGQRIAQFAKTWAETPYGTGKYKGPGAVKGKNGGADCSGATWAIYKEAGFPYGDYLDTVRFVNLVATDTHFIAAWLKDVVGADADFVKGKHFFKEVFMPQVGDIGWWHNGKAGHVLIYDPASGPAPPENVQGNAWSARDKGVLFSSVRYQWYDKIYNAQAKWYRYWKAS